MFRMIMGIVAGVIAGGVVIAIVESLGHIMFPPPEGINLKDPEALKSIMKEIPLGAKLSVLAAWGIGILGGGVVARFISQRARYSAWAVAGVLFAGAAFTMTQIPHPLWMMLGSIVVTISGAVSANRLTMSKGAL